MCIYVYIFYKQGKINTSSLLEQQSLGGVLMEIGAVVSVWVPVFHYILAENPVSNMSELGRGTLILES